MRASPELLASIEHLYTTFSDYSLPQHTDACPCCTTPEQELKLHSRPLRELGPDDLKYYAWDALLTWGNEDVFKHFLPRLFELLVALPNPSLSLVESEILFSKFRHGHWDTWPASEQEAVRAFLHRLWSDVLSDELRYEDDFRETDVCLCAIAQAEQDLAPYLEQWIDNDNLAANLTLSGFILRTDITLAQKLYENPFWEYCEAQYAQLQNWVHTPAVVSKLDRAAVRWAKTDHEQEFLAARSMLE
jgi:hypothetical protein